MPGNAKGVGVAIAPSPPPHAANPTEPRDVPSKTRNRRRCTAVDLVTDCESLLPLPMRFVSELSGHRSNCSEATRFPRVDVEPLVALRHVNWAERTGRRCGLAARRADCPRDTTSLRFRVPSSARQAGPKLGPLDRMTLTRVGSPGDG